MNPSSTGCRLLNYYEIYLDSHDIPAYVRTTGKFYLPGTLERLVTSSDRYCRRAAVLALGFLGDYSSNAALGMALQDSDRGVRTYAEQSIRAVWKRSGTGRERATVETLVCLNAQQDFREVIARATRLLAKSPALAEGWNQRAIALYCLGSYQDSIEDCRQALEINPYHFGAAAGMGQCHVHLRQYELALVAFRRALKLYPDLESVRVQVLKIERTRRRQD